MHLYIVTTVNSRFIYTWSIGMRMCLTITTTAATTTMTTTTTRTTTTAAAMRWWRKTKLTELVNLVQWRIVPVRTFSIMNNLISFPQKKKKEKNHTLSCGQSAWWLQMAPAWASYYKSSSVCLFVCLSVCSLSPPRSFDRSSPNLVGVCRWTSELPLRGSFSKRSTARRVNGSLSLSTILYMCQPHSTQLQKATLLLLQLIRLKGTFCCIDGWWVYVGGSRNWLLDG